MPRKLTYRTDQFPYHITSRSNHRTWFQIDLEEVWRISLESIKIANRKHPVSIHAFVLMSNHYHLLLDTPLKNIDSFMYELNKNFSLEIRIKTKKINRMLGGRYKWSLITSDIHYANVLKYIYLNPNKASIVDDATKYPLSTLYLQTRSLPFVTDLSPYINPTDINFLTWLKSGHTKEQAESITSGLKKTNFKFSGSREKRNPPDFDFFN
ncbi:MAG: putative transposase [Bacteriovoracaceae bacterium]|jgi:putative transposase